MTSLLLTLFTFAGRISTDILEVLRKHDGDDNEDVKKQSVSCVKQKLRTCVKKLEHSFDVFCKSVLSPSYGSAREKSLNYGVVY